MVNDQSLYLCLGRSPSGQTIQGTKDCQYCPHSFDFKMDDETVWREFFPYDLVSTTWSKMNTLTFKASLEKLSDDPEHSSSSGFFKSFVQDVARCLYRLIGSIFPFLVPQITLHMFVVRFCVKYLHVVEQNYERLKTSRKSVSLEVSNVVTS